eukprot:maker-scaffold381_size190066-snap-gene-0.30 protein:Tk01607 transcript:maker-scaffold381_size190066-snap-gene-0.30-mRNA-1 annotation:"hypothetical protein AN3340.2"
MKVFCILSTVLALTALTQAQDEAEDGVDTKSVEILQKAPSNQVSCNCQCDNYTYKGGDNQIHGNCFSADQTKAKWCYVDQYSGECDDIQYSKNRRDSHGNLRKWSYQACSTPERASHQCRNNGSFNSVINNNSNRPGRRPTRRPNHNRPGNSNYNSGSLLASAGPGVRDAAADVEDVVNTSDLEDAADSSDAIQFQ